MKTTLYFPRLRPDSYFNIGNIIYISTLFGIRSFKIIEKKELIFYCVDEQDFSRHTFAYTSNQIFSDKEFIYIKNLIRSVQDELDSEQCKPEKVYELLAMKVKKGTSEFVLFFHRLDMLFVQHRNRVRQSINFINQIISFNLKETEESLKSGIDPKDTIPMPNELKEELRQYVRSKNMSLSNYFTNEQLNKTSFNKAKKSIDNLIEESGKNSY